jgi:phosphoglycolate phosphatase-like HAD superfamily hydrolase
LVYKPDTKNYLGVMTTEPKRSWSRSDLEALEPRHEYFVGIDSDGCVFDTMEIKQKKCFHPRIISHWSLEPIEQYLREAAEFANLYSRWRGRNRFLCLIKIFDLLRSRKEVIESGTSIPELPSLRRFIDSGVPLGNPSLEKAVQETNDPELASLLKWNKDVNNDVAETVKNVPPFKWVMESLEKIRDNADSICVSQTPCEALVREWTENNLLDFVAAIAGQELGTKAEHIGLATKDKYSPDKILMIGDAPGDRKAARANGALFYPINPAHEEESWERFYGEAFDRFLTGKYRGSYEEKLIADFEALLPDRPPWEL